MSWVAVFWIVYGVGSTLFVVYLFKLGKNVASDRNELVQQEIDRFRSETADHTGRFPAVIEAEAVKAAKPDCRSNLHVQRVFQPDAEHVAVQGVRDGATCLINLPIGQVDGMFHAAADHRVVAEKV